MSLLGLMTLGVLVGYRTRSPLVVALPALIALCVTAAIAATGGALADTPIAFAAVTATFGVGLGSLARRFGLWEIP